MHDGFYRCCPAVYNTMCIKRSGMYNICFELYGAKYNRTDSLYSWRLKSKVQNRKAILVCTVHALEYTVPCTEFVVVCIVCLLEFTIHCKGKEAYVQIVSENVKYSVHEA